MSGFRRVRKQARGNLQRRRSDGVQEPEHFALGPRFLRLTFKPPSSTPLKRAEQAQPKWWVHGPNRWRYSPDKRNALTISALTKLPLNWFNFVSQKS